MEPVLSPRITQLLVERWVEAATIPKPTAAGTMLRYSGAHSCLRAMGYDAFHAEFSEPVKPASAWSMNLGSLIHAALQEVISQRWPEAINEFKSQASEHVSGHADSLIAFVDGPVLYELKTMGSYPFDKAMGYKRMFKNSKRVEANGPSLAHVAQAGMNALGAELTTGTPIETVIIGVLTYEPVRADAAQVMEINELDRFLGEFHYPRDAWEPLARTELNRMEEAAQDILAGYLPDRFAVDDVGEEMRLTCEEWRCDYCPHLSTCVRDGAGRLHHADSTMTIRSKNG